jgi:hypothetical protein
MIKFFLKTSFLLLFIFILTGCSTSNEDDSLYVKFENPIENKYTINVIQLMDMGSASANESTPSGVWGENILLDGKVIAPNESVFFTLDIPNGDWSTYRLGIIDENGNSIMLHEQVGYIEGMQPSITHWGGDDRTVSVNIQKDQTTGIITINGYSDWVGID